MQSWHIRPATAQDSGPLTRCIDVTYAAYKTQINDLPAVSEGVAEDIEAHNVWVAEQDQIVVGGLI